MRGHKVLDVDFFKRGALEVAPDLLGKFLVRNVGGRSVALPITEVEAYVGESDLACHASRGRTKRTEVMFWEGGYWYVYLVYGMHEMLNVVVGEKDSPEAVLIRGAGAYNGPGKLTRALDIDRQLNREQVEIRSGLWIEDRGVQVSEEEMLQTPRVGINYAGEPWISKPWRFAVKEMPRPS